jgi:hypothetical protein
MAATRGGVVGGKACSWGGTGIILGCTAGPDVTREGGREGEGSAPADEYRGARLRQAGHAGEWERRLRRGHPVSPVIHERRASELLGRVLIAWLFVSRVASATTWVIDTKGSDGNPGTAAAPWRTWAKFITAINAGTIRPGDTVLFRPGRYMICDGLSSPYQSLDGPGGAPGQPITVSVDTSQPGDVEFDGSARPGKCGVPAWQQALWCASGPNARAVCNSDADCGGAAGSCVTLPGVWWTVAASDTGGGNYFGGLVAGAAFQPATTPGGAPKIYERLYAQAGSAQVKMPTFTPGHAQMMPYAMLPGTWQGQNACTAPRVPWFCCTGLGTGTCSNSRIYVQTETGADPGTVGDANFGPVEFPFMPFLIWNPSQTTTLQYVTFTNNNNGRMFHFRWALTGMMVLKNADTVTFEDTEFGYLSRSLAQAHLNSTGVANASTFPPYNQGDSYMIVGWWDNGGSNVVRNITFRRGSLHGTLGNEVIHFLGGPKARFYPSFLLENMEIGDAPFAVPNGQAGTTLTPNAYTNQVQKSWPPAGYGAWASEFPTHWGPLGGGSNTEGIISGADGETVRNCYIHDGDIISFFEGKSGDLLFENNRVDLARHYYAGYGGSSLYPGMLISYCGSPTACGGLAGDIGLTLPTRFDDATMHGPIVRNNVFDNVYTNAIRTGAFADTLPPYRPVTAGMIVNNTFHVKGDFRSASGDPEPIIWFWAGQPTGMTVQGADGSKFLFKNNIIVRDTASTHSLPLLRIDASLASQVDVDYNNWGGQNGVWQIGNTVYTNYASFATALRSYGASNEVHSLNVDPLFVTPYTDLRLQLTSPSYQSGVDLSTLAYGAFTRDYLGQTRPANQWSMGAYQGGGAGVTTTTIQAPVLLRVTPVP